MARARNSWDGELVRGMRCLQCGAEMDHTEFLSHEGPEQLPLIPCHALTVGTIQHDKNGELVMQFQNNWGTDPNHYNAAEAQHHRVEGASAATPEELKQALLVDWFRNWGTPYNTSNQES